MSKQDRSLSFIWEASPQNRYKNFIHRVADYEEVWMIGNKQGELLSETDSQKSICVWPCEQSAERYRTEVLQNFDCSSLNIDLDTFVDNLRDCELTLNIFPNGKDEIIIKPKTLLDDLLEELEQY